VKSHLLDSDEPLLSGQDYVARCGARVAKAHFSFALIAGECFAMSTLLFCTKCIAGKPLLSKRYLYGMLDGEKAKHLESQED
jgi:hypothetical protein